MDFDYSKIIHYFKYKNISASIRQDWYLAMAKTAADGLPQVDILEKLKYNFKKINHPLGGLIDELLNRLRGSKSVQSSKVDIRTIGTELVGLVPEDESMMIQAGESSGRIAEGFTNAANLIDMKKKLVGSVVTALTKPFVYFLALNALFLYFSLKILPAFEKSRPRIKWPPAAAALGTVADNILLISGSLILLIVVSMFVVSYLSKNWIGEQRDWADRNLPPFNMIAQLKAATFMGSLAGFISSGIPFSDAIANMRNGTSIYNKEQCNRVLGWIRMGKRPTDCLILLPMIHIKYHWIIDVYGLSNDSSYAYKTIAKEIIDKTIKSITIVFGLIISNSFLLMMMVCIMWIYTSIFAIADIR